MPRCLGASGSVRVSTKIQLARWPAEVQIFWPLMTHSSPSSTARRAEVAQVGAGVGLGVALAPLVLAAEDLGDELALLLLGAPLQDGVAHHLDGEGVVGAAGGHAGLGELLGQHDLLLGRQAGAAVLLGPGRGQQVVVAQDLAPALDPRLDLVGRQRTDALPVGGQGARPGRPGSSRGTARRTGPTWVACRESCTVAPALSAASPMGSAGHWTPMSIPRARSDDRGRADQRPGRPEPGRHDPGPHREVEGTEAVDLGLGGREERLAVAEGHGASDHGQAQVEEVGDRGHRTAHQRSRAAPDLVGRVGRWRARCAGRSPSRWPPTRAARPDDRATARCRRRRTRARCGRRCRRPRRGADHG